MSTARRCRRRVSCARLLSPAGRALLKADQKGDPMPHPFIPQLETLWRAVVALYEPAIFYLGVAGMAAYVTAIEAGSIASRVNGPWLELAAYAAGSLADLHFRGRVYATLPEARRMSRLREWKSRLGLAAIGLAGAFFASLPVHAWLDLSMPEIGAALYPVVNFAFVLVAVPVIDAFRGLFRILTGTPTQEAFAGLVISWASRRAGAERPPDDPPDDPPPPPSPRTGEDS